LQPRSVIVGGRTGVGKTRVLHALAQRGAQVLDLEGVAVHRGSSFGWKAEQPSNEAFENTLALLWRDFSTESPVFVEDEEGHVGACLVPPALYSRMAAAKLVVRVNSPIEARVNVLLDEYAHDAAHDETAFRKRIEDATRRLSRRLGPDRVTEIVDHVHKGRYAEVARMLLGYYDKLYDAHLAKRDGMDATVVDVFVTGDALDADATASDVLAEVKRFGFDAANERGAAVGGAPRRDDGGPRRPRLHLLLAAALAAALALRLLRR
jgi:tRNA 2-selenouridine synthase